MKEMSIARNFAVGDTYIQQMMPGTKLKTFGNYIENASYHKVGFSISEETQKDYAKKLVKEESLKNKIENTRKGLGENNVEDTYNTDRVKESLEGLSEEEKTHIETYSTYKYGEYSAKSYGYIKDDSKVTDNDIELINKTIKSIENSGKREKNFIYRGARTPDGVTKKEYLENINIGDVAITNRITSTTRDLSVAHRFNQDEYNDEHITMIYHTKKGAYIAPISSNKDEEEVLLGIGEKMVVVDKGIDENNQAYIIFSDAKE